MDKAWLFLGGLVAIVLIDAFFVGLIFRKSKKDQDKDDDASKGL